MSLQTNQNGNSRTQKVWTYEELQSVKEDRHWVIMNDNVYDVKAFTPYHPGGVLLIQHFLYTDITDHMTRFHPEYVLTKKLPNYFMGKVDLSSFPVTLRCQTQLSKDFRDLEQQMIKDGLFKPTYFYYAFKALQILAMLATAVYMVVTGPHTLGRVVIAAIIHGSANQQLGYMLHDSSHNAVFQNRKYDHMLSTFICNILGGFSVGLWKDDHLTHHVVTNQVGHDPDLQLLPLACASTDFFKGVYSSFHMRRFEFGAFTKFMVSIQDKLMYFYIPLFKMMLYLLAPLFIVFHPRSREAKAELMTLTVHFAWFSYLVSHLPSWQLVLVYFLVNNTVTSVLFLQIIAAHIAMPTIKDVENEEFVKHQLRTTMDIDCAEIFDWWHGGLFFQIPHHVWPGMARPYLRKAQSYLQKFAEEHGLEYKRVTPVQCLMMTIEHIAGVAKEARLYFSKTTKGE